MAGAGYDARHSGTCRRLAFNADECASPEYVIIVYIAIRRRGAEEAMPVNPAQQTKGNDT